MDEKGFGGNVGKNVNQQLENISRDSELQGAKGTR